jgi:uncharacterized metal-binding protein YceD (DUF177 family)
MKVHLQQIPTEGKRYEGELSNSILDLRENDIQPVSPVSYSLDIGLSEGGLFATGQIGVDVELQCVCCLERFRYPIRIEGFACQVELTGSETIDLTEPLREDILLALPPHPRCDWSAERVCPGMLIEAAPLSDHDSSEVPPNVWGALDQLKLK